jgi:hypothetical protein
MRYVMLAGLLMLAGCGAPTSSYWQKAGASSQDFYAEQGQCEAQAYTISRPLEGQIERAYHACMRGKGWVLQQEEWTGRSAMQWSRDDFSCSGQSKGGPAIRGPEWAECMEGRGWKRSTR